MKSVFFAMAFAAANVAAPMATAATQEEQCNWANFNNSCVTEEREKARETAAQEKFDHAEQLAIEYAAANSNENHVCGVVLCLSNGMTAPHECTKHLDNYFSIRVYKKKRGKKIFQPAQTQMERKRQRLDMCPEGDDHIKMMIHSTFGPLEHNPVKYQ